MRMFNSFTLFIVTTLFVVSASAFDFSQADRLFAQRENNPSVIGQARSLYENALNQSSSSNQEKIRAVYGLGRLAFYEGDLLVDEKDDSKRVAIFSKCLEYVDKIHPSKIGETGAFYYFKSLCMGLWAKSAPRTSVMGKIAEYKDTLNKGIAKFSSYEQGGLYRIYANTLVADPMLKLFGLYDPAKALEYADKAIELGSQHYNVYMIKADALKRLEKRPQGVTLLEDTVEALENAIADGKLLRGFEPESKGFLTQVKKMMRKY